MEVKRRDAEPAPMTWEEEQRRRVCEIADGLIDDFVEEGQVAEQAAALRHACRRLASQRRSSAGWHRDVQSALDMIKKMAAAVSPEG